MAQGEISPGYVDDLLKMFSQASSVLEGKRKTTTREAMSLLAEQTAAESGMEITEKKAEEERREKMLTQAYDYLVEKHGLDKSGLIELFVDGGSSRSDAEQLATVILLAKKIKNL